MTKRAFSTTERARILTVYDELKSARKAARALTEEGIKVDFTTVARMDRERASGVSVPPKGDPPKIAPPPPLPPPEETAELPPLADDASLGARVLWQELAETRRRLRALPRGADHATEYASLSRVATSQALQLEKLMPSKPADPAKDPMNIQARATLHAHLLSTIEAVEARSNRICVRCRNELGRLPPRDDT
jgi:hypothetical protein